MIIWLILIDVALDNLWILLGENWCWSLLGLKGLKQVQNNYQGSLITVYYFNHFYHMVWNTEQGQRLPTPLGSSSRTLFEQWCRFFDVPQQPDKWKCCEPGPMIFHPYPRRLESLTICRCHCKGSTFSSVILKTLSVVTAGVWTCDLLLSRPALSQLRVIRRQLSQISLA